MNQLVQYKPREGYYHKTKNYSDMPWIEWRIASIPPEQQREVISEYERLYKSNAKRGREMANKMLHKTSKKYKNAQRQA